jgi:hypothetical protein
MANRMIEGTYELLGAPPGRGEVTTGVPEL